MAMGSVFIKDMLGYWSMPWSQSQVVQGSLVHFRQILEFNMTVTSAFNPGDHGGESITKNEF